MIEWDNRQGWLGNQLRTTLLEYCGQDTLATVRLSEKLRIDGSLGSDSRYRSTPTAAVDLPFR